MALSYTRSGVRRSGDDYQDIVALELMVEWLENPRRFERMFVEADDSGALDDVRVERADGSILVRQVKFSAHPERVDDAWDWSTLLAKREGKTNAQGQKKQLPSLLQKWAASWAMLTEDGRAVDAAVVSNRMAAPDLAHSLSPEGYVSLDAVADEATRAEIINQIGDEAQARRFLSRFRFRLAYASYEALAERLLRRFCVVGGDENGWNNLQVELGSWVRHREMPPPDGAITLAEVRRAARWYQLQSLPQEFVIPSDYVLPDRDFHRALLKEILELESGCRVLTASPGAGKSTYCSALFRELRERKIPAVRHHYFLSLAENRFAYGSYERLNHRKAAESLMHDLALEHHEALSGLELRNPRPEDLRDWIVQCGEFYAARDQSLVVIVDGLDHVWRENASIEELRRLLDFLLPAPPGVVVLLATQPVEDDKLPPVVTRHAPRQGWFRLPFLHQESIKRWLLHHKKEIWPQERPVDNYQLGRLAQAFYDRSQGHPLYLRYSLKALQDQGQAVSEYTVERLPVSPHENITEYYQTLDSGLSEEGRQILHLLGACQFSWPREGILDCLASQPADLSRVITALRQVEHLLVEDDLGLRPFHSSLLVWVQSLELHAAYAERLRPQTLAWLRLKAPEAWRWAYEWMLQADLGDAEPLRNGPNRRWAIEAVAQRRAGDEVETILARAGWCALESRDVPRAIEIGLTADHVHNTYHYYDHILEPLLFPQLVVEEDVYLRRRLHAGRDDASDIEIALLAEAEKQRGNTPAVHRCFDDLVHRSRTGRLRSTGGEGNNYTDGSKAIMRTVALIEVADEAAPVGDCEVDRVLDWAVRQRDDQQTRRFTELLAEALRTAYNAVGARRALRLTALKPKNLQGEKTTPRSEEDAINSEETPEEVSAAAEMEEASEAAEEEAKVNEDETPDVGESRPLELAMQRTERAPLVRHAVWLALENDLRFDDVLSEAQNSGDPFALLYFCARGRTGDQSIAAPEGNYEWPADAWLSIHRHDHYNRRASVEGLFYELFYTLLANVWAGRQSENQRWLQRGGLGNWPRRFLHRLNEIAIALVTRLIDKTPTSFLWLYEQLADFERPHYRNPNSESDAHYSRAASFATVRIGLDLWILLRAMGVASSQFVPLAELRTAFAGHYCSRHLWLSEVIARRRMMLSPGDARSWLTEEENQLRASITELNERAEEWTKLASFAAIHGLKDEARVLIRDAASCMVAHYFHKETSFYTLLDGLKTFHHALMDTKENPPNEAETREWLLQVATPVAQVTEFTDGDETNHLPVELSEVMATTAPEWLPTYWAWLNAQENYADAGPVFREWLEVADLTDPLDAAVATTALDPKDVQVLSQRAANDAAAAAVLSRTVSFLGEEALAARAQEESSNDARGGEREELPPVEDYPPEKINEFFEEVDRRRLIYRADDAIEAWNNYWAVQAPHRAPAALEAALNRYEKRAGWDGLFRVTLQQHGKERAYEHLVRAHREGHSWIYHFSSRDEARWRWKQVRDIYPEKWFDFLLDTMRGASVPWEGSASWDRVSLGYSTWAHLTEYLVVQNQIDLARNVVSQMVASQLDAVSTVPLPEPEWVTEVRRSNEGKNAGSENAERPNGTAEGEMQ